MEGREFVERSGSRPIAAVSGFGSSDLWTMRTPTDRVGLSGVSILTIAGERPRVPDSPPCSSGAEVSSGQWVDHPPGPVSRYDPGASLDLRVSDRRENRLAVPHRA